MKPGSMYLLAYNASQTLGWGIILGKTACSIGSHGTAKHVWKDVHFELKIFQTLALMEIVHCLLGLVRSPVLTTAMQVCSRLIILWPVTWKVHTAQNSTGVAIYVLAWSITEVIRYPFYAGALLDSTPKFLQFLRYTLFIVLYPLGVLGEILTVIAALPEVRRRKIYSVAMPNSLNMSFSYFHVLIVFMLLYIPLFPQLYFYMFAQRKKVLGGDDRKKKAQ